MNEQNVTHRKNISAFLDLVAAKLFDAAMPATGSFSLDELDEAKHEAMCAARAYLRGQFNASAAIQHVKDAVQRGRCAHEPTAEYHL